MADFSFRRDLKNVLWKNTLWLNLVRAACAGVIYGIVFLLAPPRGATGIERFTMPLMMPIMLPCMYLILFVPMGLCLGLLGAMGVPYAGFMSNIVGLFIAIGDPIVNILQRIRPQWLPVEQFGLFNFTLIVFVLKPDQMTSA